MSQKKLDIYLHFDKIIAEIDVAAEIELASCLDDCVATCAVNKDRDNKLAFVAKIRDTNVALLDTYAMSELSPIIFDVCCIDRNGRKIVAIRPGFYSSRFENEWQTLTVQGMVFVAPIFQQIVQAAANLLSFWADSSHRLRCNCCRQPFDNVYFVCRARICPNKKSCFLCWI